MAKLRAAGVRKIVAPRLICNLPFRSRTSVATGDGLPYGGRALTNGERSLMPSPRELAVAELRRSIDVLPVRTRQAMLSGVTSNTVITGAFSDGSGVCPLLAAHREGGRTSCVSFPEAWDRFCGVWGRNITRQATQEEVGVLRAQLEASFNVQVDTLLSDAITQHLAMVDARRRRTRVASDAPLDLAGAIDEHRETARQRRAREATEVGLDWLFEETLVLPEDFGREPAPEPEDFAGEPAPGLEDGEQPVPGTTRRRRFALR